MDLKFTDPDIYTEDHILKLYHKVVADKNSKHFYGLIINSSVIRRGLENYIKDDHQKELVDQFNCLGTPDHKKAVKLPRGSCLLSTIMRNGTEELLTIALDFICKSNPENIIKVFNKSILFHNSYCDSYIHKVIWCTFDTPDCT